MTTIAVVVGSVFAYVVVGWMMCYGLYVVDRVRWRYALPLSVLWPLPALGYGLWLMASGLAESAGLPRRRSKLPEARVRR